MGRPNYPAYHEKAHGGPALEERQDYGNVARIALLSWPLGFETLDLESRRYPHRRYTQTILRHQEAQRTQYPLPSLVHMEEVQEKEGEEEKEKGKEGQERQGCEEV